MCRRYSEWHSEWHEEAALGRVGAINESDALPFACPRGTVRAIDTAAGHWQAVLSDLAMLTGRNTDDAARLSRFMEVLHRCFDLVERRQMTVAEVCRKMSIGKTTYYRYWRKVKSAPHRERHTELFEELQAKIEANELSISAACRQMNNGR